MKFFPVRTSLITGGLISISALMQQHALALPVFPGAIGFGTDTIAGRNAAEADIYRVTTLDDDASNPQPGSLRYGVEKIARPRVIIFEVAGVIALDGGKDIMVRKNDTDGAHGYLTIAGQTAPFPGITLRNAGIWISSNDVLVQHIGIRPGNVVASASEGGGDLGFNNKDCVKVSTLGSVGHHIVLDHISCSWSVDEAASVLGDGGGSVHDVTFSNSIFAHGIMNGEPGPSGGSIRVHSKGSHGYGPLVTDDSSNVSFVRNLMAFESFRNPQIRGATSGAQVVNNFIYRPGFTKRDGISVGDMSEFSSPAAVSIVGNILVRHPVPISLLHTGPATMVGSTWTYPAATYESHTSYSSPAIYIYPQTNASGSVYASDNTIFNPQTSLWEPASGGQWQSSFIREDTDVPKNQVSAVQRATSDPYAGSGGTAWTPLASSAVEATIQASVGKFPGLRDDVDSALLNNVQNRTGTYLERFSQLGSNPWAPLAGDGNSRPLTLPANPTLDDDGDGYTNLEEWLHGWAAHVEGRAHPAIAVSDTFEDNDRNGWIAQTATSTWSVVTDGSKVLQQSYPTNDAVARLEQTSFTDQVVEAKVKVTSFTSADRFARVFARFRDTGNAYYVTLRSTGVVELKELSGGVASSFDIDSLPINTTDWYHVRLAVQGANLTATVRNLTTNATVTLTGTDASPPPAGGVAVGTFHAQAVFDDVFASPFPSDVPQVVDDFAVNTAANWATNGGTWSIANGVYSQTVNNNGNARSTRAAATTYANQSIQARVKIKSVDATGRFAALYGRYQDPENSYFLLIRRNSSGLGSVELKRIAGNVSAMIPSVLPVPFEVDLNEWYTLRLEVTGGATQTTLKGYVDGVLVAEGTDTNPAAFTSGKAALGTYRAETDFDNVIITSP